VKIDGARNRLPTGPRGNACSSTATASASIPIRSMAESTSAGTPASRPMISG
jgi:hypothetical protein